MESASKVTPKPSINALTNMLHEALPGLRQRYGLRALWLFGSFVRGDASQESDLDVLVAFDNERLSLLEFIQLEQELSDLLQIKVDLVERNTLKPAVGKEILREAVAV